MSDVTGFFRDPEAWDALDRKVIAPLTGGRHVCKACAEFDAASRLAVGCHAAGLDVVRDFARDDPPRTPLPFATSHTNSLK